MNVPSSTQTCKVLDIVSGKFCLFVWSVLAQPGSHRVLGFARFISCGLRVQAVLLKNKYHTLTDWTQRRSWLRDFNNTQLNADVIIISVVVTATHLITSPFAFSLLGHYARAVVPLSPERPTHPPNDKLEVYKRHLLHSTAAADTSYPQSQTVIGEC